MRPIGQVDLLPSGKHRARLPVDGHRVTIGLFGTEDEARDALAKAATVAAGATYEPTDSLARYGERVLTRAAARGTDSATRDLYVWQAHVVGSRIGSMRLAAVRGRHVREWAEGLVDGGIMASTARSYVHVLARVFRRAVEDELVEDTPTRVRLVLEQDDDADPVWTALTPAEREAVLSCEAIPLRDRALIAFAIHTGLRAGELCALRTAQVTDAGVEVRYGKPPAKPTKTRRVRFVPLLPEARRWWDVARQWSGGPHGLAFPAPKGGFRTPHRVLSQQRSRAATGPRWVTGWALALEAAGVRRVRWHDLRHTFGSALASGEWGRAWSLPEIAEMMGHASTRMTERYVHTAATHLREAAAATPGALAPRLAPRSEPVRHRIQPKSLEIRETGEDVEQGRTRSLATSTNAGVPASSWGDRGADALRALLAGDPGPAEALVREEPLVAAWLRWQAGHLSGLIEAVGLVAPAGAGEAVRGVVAGIDRSRK